MGERLHCSSTRLAIPARVIVKDNMLTAADIAAIARSNVKQTAKRNGIVGTSKTQQARNVVQEPESDMKPTCLEMRYRQQTNEEAYEYQTRKRRSIWGHTARHPLSDTEAPAGKLLCPHNRRARGRLQTRCKPNHNTRRSSASNTISV